MSFEQSETEESTSSLSEVSSLDDDFVRMDLESENADDEDADDELDSPVWSEIQPKSDAEFMEDYGLVQEVTSASRDNTILPIDCYRHFITDEIIDLMVRETNRYAEQYLQTHDISRRSKSHQWKPTNDVQFSWNPYQDGIIQMPKLEHYWSKSQLYGSEVIRSAMARDRFELLLKFWHFPDNNKYHSRQDRLFKLKPILDLLKARFRSVYIPGAVVTVDETMIPWRGRLLFKQYISGKAHKYGVKMYMLAATNGYTWNYLIYTDEQDPMAGLGHAETIVMNLLDCLLGCYRTVVANNFFTSISLAKSLLARDTYLIGTLRRNHTASGKERKLKRGEVYGLQNEEGLKLIMWKDKKDILMISTKPSHSAGVIDGGKINFRNEPIMKSKVVVDYNKGRQGTDLSDHYQHIIHVSDDL